MPDENTIITKKGYGLLKSAFSDAEMQRVRRDTTVKPIATSDYSIPEPFEIYKESQKYLYIPKFYGLSRYGVPERTSVSEGSQINISFKGDIRQNQIDPCKQAKNQLEQFGGGVLCLPCGFGKTVMAINLICWLGKKALVIVNKEFLLNQWKERIQQFSDAKVGIIQQNKTDIKDKDIVIGMLHSISMKDYPKELFGDFGTLIVDEVHHIAARVFSNALLKISTKFMIGLSATPERKDGLSKVFEWFMGDVFLKVDRKEQKVIVNRISFVCKDQDYCKEVVNFRGKANLPRMINNITEYSPRNEFILKIITGLSIKKRRILLLSDRRAHLEDINKRVIKDTVCSVGFYVGGMKQKLLKESEGKDLILGTFMMAAEAMDIPALDTLILASPKGDIEQAVGRILRTCKQDISPVVIDIVDSFSTFENQSYKRNRFFKKHGYQIHNTFSKESNYNIDHLVYTLNDIESSLKDTESLIKDTGSLIKDTKSVKKQTNKPINNLAKLKSGVCLLD